MSSPEADAAFNYLRQIQPHDLATVMPHIQHDLQMLLGSYSSYFELLETQLKTSGYPEAIAVKCLAGIRDLIRVFRRIVDNLPTYHDVLTNSYDVFGHWQTKIGHGLRSRSAHFIGWADMVEFGISDGTMLPQATQQLQHLNQAMRLTAERLRVIAYACLRFNPYELA